MAYFQLVKISDFGFDDCKFQFSLNQYRKKEVLTVGFYFYLILFIKLLEGKEKSNCSYYVVRTMVEI